MRMKLNLVASALALAVTGSAVAGNVSAVQVYNNLYNQSATGGALGLAPSAITVDFYNGATKCDTAIVGFRALVNVLVGTGASQKCAAVSSIKVIAGFSTMSSTLQVYSTTPVTISLASEFEHSVIIQDLGTGVTGTPASDGSIAPVFDTTNGTIATLGKLGYEIIESKIR